MVTVVNKGLEMIAKLVGGVSTDKMQYVALGSGTTDEANDQTGLTTEITTNGGARAAGTCSYEAEYKFKVTKTFTFTGTLAINEIGIFDAASSGNMLLRGKLSATKNVGDGDSLQVNTTVTFARAA
jgi:hypothetical protein